MPRQAESPMLARSIALRPVLTITAAGALSLAGYEMVRSAASSVFLAHHSASRLPEALMLVPLAMIAFTLLYSVVLRRIGPASTFILTLIGAAGILALFAFAVRRQMPGSSLLLYVFAQAYIVFIVEEVWAFINSILIPGEGKRMNGLIIALGTVGSVTGGVVTGKLSMRIGSERIIFLAAILTAAAAVVGRAAFRLVRDQPPSPDRQPVRLADHFAWDLLRTEPTIGRLAMIVAASQSVSVLLDIAFHRILQGAIPLQDPRTAFLGYFWGGVNLFSLLLQMVVCPLLLARLPLRRIHGAIPLLYGAAALTGVAFPVLPVLGAVFFLSKTVDYSLFRAAKEVLYIPLSFTARYRAKMTVDALIYRSTKGVTSALLAVADRVFGSLPVRLFPALVTVLCGVWRRFTRGLPEPPASGTPPD
jgi:AAA family ATP:ADP antiporter